MFCPKHYCGVFIDTGCFKNIDHVCWRANFPNPFPQFQRCDCVRRVGCGNFFIKKRSRYTVGRTALTSRLANIDIGCWRGKITPLDQVSVFCENTGLVYSTTAPQRPNINRNHHRQHQHQPTLTNNHPQSTVINQPPPTTTTTTTRTTTTTTARTTTRTQARGPPCLGPKTTTEFDYSELRKR